MLDSPIVLLYKSWTYKVVFFIINLTSKVEANILFFEEKNIMSYK